MHHCNPCVDETRSINGSGKGSRKISLKRSGKGSRKRSGKRSGYHSWNVEGNGGQSKILNESNK